MNYAFESDFGDLMFSGHFLCDKVVEIKNLK